MRIVLGGWAAGRLWWIGKGIRTGQKGDKRDG
jgi:hypothetical protein